MKLAGCYTPLPLNFFIAWCIIKHRDKFTFLLAYTCINSVHFHFRVCLLRIIVFVQGAWRPQLYQADLLSTNAPDLYSGPILFESLQGHRLSSLMYRHSPTEAVGIEYTLSIYRSKSSWCYNTLEHDRTQHAWPTACVVAQQYSSFTFVSLPSARFQKYYFFSV